jgi:integrase
LSPGQQTHRLSLPSIVIVEPKSVAGNRSVPIPNVLRHFVAEHKLLTGGKGFVFGSKPSHPFTPSNLRRRAETAWRSAGLDSIGLHEARHTYASLMIAAGVNAKAVSSYMGHASVAITLDRYGHLMPGSEGEAAALLDDYLERVRFRGDVLVSASS